MRKAALSAFFLVFCGFAEAQELPLVLHASGTVEVQRASAGGWTPMTEAVRPRRGDSIRTGAKSFVDFAMDPAICGVVRLGEKSTAKILSAELWENFAGKIWVLWEYDEASGKSPLEVRAEGLEVRIDGGAYVESGVGRTEIRSFGEVSVSDDAGKRGTIGEGFRARLDAEDTSPLERLGYSDYQNWRTWVTTAYKYQDKKSQ